MPLFLLLIFLFSSGASQTSLTSAPVSATQSSFTIQIPAIGAAANIEQVGLDADGSMGVTKGAADVAWYENSSRPGSAGTSVIAGHSGWYGGISATFDSLGKLQVGDRIYIDDSKAGKSVFVVREIKKYGEHEDTSSLFVPSTAGSHLNLVTCAGDWNSTTQSYSERLVVFADKV